MARLTFLVGLWLLCACGSSLPVPARTEHPESAFVEVPYPPPAALVEVVPARPQGDAVWVDGAWVWRGRYYVWQRGGWVLPPKGSAYAGWQAQLAEDGRLLFAPGTWYDAAQQPLDPPTRLATARTPPNEQTLETEVAR